MTDNKNETVGPPKEDAPQNPNPEPTTEKKPEESQPPATENVAPATSAEQPNPQPNEEISVEVIEQQSVEKNKASFYFKKIIAAFDIEKPFLMWLWRDYPRVKKFHRAHARHHFAYEGDKGYDYLGMVIDWECSRFSKADAQMNAIETYDYELHKYMDAGNMRIVKELQLNIFPIIVNLNLVKTDKDIKDLYANIKPIETN